MLSLNRYQNRSYDHRKGWRGPISNINYTKDWPNKIKKKHRLEKSISWQIAIVKEIKQFSAFIETEEKIKGTIRYQDISWTKKEFKDLLKVGDLIYVKKLDKQFYSLKQLPKIPHRTS